MWRHWSLRNIGAHSERIHRIPSFRGQENETDRQILKGGKETCHRRQFLRKKECLIRVKLLQWRQNEDKKEAQNLAFGSLVTFVRCYIATEFVTTFCKYYLCLLMIINFFFWFSTELVLHFLIALSHTILWHSCIFNSPFRQYLLPQIPREEAQYLFLKENPKQMAHTGMKKHRENVTLFSVYFTNSKARYSFKKNNKTNPDI